MTSTQSLRSVCLRRTKQLLGLKIPKKEEVKRMLLCFFSLCDGFGGSSCVRFH
jgi:hypothetical protein